MAEPSESRAFMDVIVREHVALRAAATPQATVSLNGQSLTVSEVVAVALYGASCQVTEDITVHDRVEESVDFLEQELAQGHTVYGVTTGFGGSADARTTDTETLQDGLVKMLNAGILLPSDNGHAIDDRICNELLCSHALPRAIVKATMLIRSNSLLRGHSGVRMEVIHAVMSLLDNDMVPIAPLRGSISASGDLGPLSYIAGAVQGNADIHLSIDGSDHDCRRGAETIVTAPEALRLVGVEPQRLRAKEGLGIVNGTSVSAAAAAIVIYRAKQIALLSQALTAMGTEALGGTEDNYKPFISAVRSHSGQTEAAANIASFLQGSRLATQGDPLEHGLAQDRYALRTAPQWIGPQLEDLLLAQRQVEVELNSTTDNPLIDVEGRRIHHGGNFQATSLTSAMEKTTLALHNFGRLLFAQCTELVNNKLNNGLPPNLCVDEPSLSYTFKGLDITMAAYMSELASLAHPVSPHVVNAEMGNQSLNSLALIAARRALECVEISSLMSAAYIYALCQAVDLRYLGLEFVKMAEPMLQQIVRSTFGHATSSSEAMTSLERRAWVDIMESWSDLAHLDLEKRCRETSRKSLGSVVETLQSHQMSATLAQLEDYQTRVAAALRHAYAECRERLFSAGDTPSYLGAGSKRIYTFVRHHLSVPLHRGFSKRELAVTKLCDSHSNGTVRSDWNGQTSAGADSPSKDRINGCPLTTSEKKPNANSSSVGTMASQIYLSICNGALPAQVLDLDESREPLAGRVQHRGKNVVHTE